jgi:hypothetical protein
VAQGCATFSVGQRDLLRDRLLTPADGDPADVGAAVTGSHASADAHPARDASGRPITLTEGILSVPGWSPALGAAPSAGRYGDHWLVEHWQDRWVLADIQLDPDLRRILGVTFDPDDVPRDQFLVAGEVYNFVRAARESSTG